MVTPVLPSAQPTEPLRSPTLPSAARLPALDGVRGLAILLVMVNNLYPEKPSIPLDRWVEAASNAGWMGVDLFFVLSGFLITGILLDTRTGPRYFRNFYARRALRILPLYYGFLLVVLALTASGAIGTAPERALFLHRQSWYWTYMVNVMTSWKGPWEAVFGTGGFWSLAVEEQFYLVWPVIVLLLPRRGLVALCLAMVVASAALRLVWLRADLSSLAMYQLTPARMDTLAIGALLAVAVRTRSAHASLVRWAGPVLPLSVGLLLAMAAWRHGLSAEDFVVQTIGYSLIALMFGALMVRVVLGGSDRRLARAFQRPTLRFLGRYSYGIYVFQGPVMLLMEARLPFVRGLPTVMGSHVPVALGVFLLASVGSIAAAVLSWHWYESRFLRLKERFPSHA
jgi:peptidoglycan/LPS O-acetylase OafA/YrhL